MTRYGQYVTTVKDHDNPPMSESAGFPLPSKEIVDGVFLVDTLAGHVPGLVASYLVKGKKIALIDVGHATSADTVLSELRGLGADAWHVDYLIPTHVHLDHAGAVGRLASVMPHARVMVNEHGAKHLVDPSKLIEWQARLFGTESLSVFGAPLAVPMERIEAVGDRYDLDLGDGKTLRLFWTPGHAPHHMSVLLEDQQLLMTGDAVGVRYPGFDFPIPVTPPPSFDEDLYLRTLRQIKDISPAGLLLPHFGPVLKNTRKFLQSNLETTEHWGRKVFEAVDAGKPINQVREFFVTDVAQQARKSREEIPDHIIRGIRLSAAGYYSYAQKKRAG